MTHTESEIVEHIRRLADDDAPPTAGEFRADSAAPDPSTAANRFGSWNEAVEAAGFEPQPASGKIPSEQLIDHIRRLADDDGPPTASEFRADSAAPDPLTAANRFGSWNEAVEAAGFEPQPASGKIPSEQLIDHIRRLADDDGPPTAGEFRADSAAPHPSTAVKRFGSWNEAVDAAGFEPQPASGKIPSEQLIDHIRRLADDDGPPTAGEFRADSAAPTRQPLRNASAVGTRPSRPPASSRSPHQANPERAAHRPPSAAR